MDFLQNTEYRYCAFDWKSDLQDYLFAYKENPRIELITKLVSSKYAVNKNIVSRATKDKQFIVFLKNNAAEIKRLHASANAVIQAYRDNKPIEDVVRAEEVRKSLTTECGANDTTRAIYAAISVHDFYFERRRSVAFRLYRLYQQQRDSRQVPRVNSC